MRKFAFFFVVVSFLALPGVCFSFSLPTVASPDSSCLLGEKQAFTGSGTLVKKTTVQSYRPAELGVYSWSLVNGEYLWGGAVSGCSDYYSCGGPSTRYEWYRFSSSCIGRTDSSYCSARTNPDQLDPDSCSDGVLNCGETSVDRGGACLFVPNPHPGGYTDPETGHTYPGTCYDGVQNGQESGIDCGGTCKYLCGSDGLADTSRLNPSGGGGSGSGGNNDGGNNGSGGSGSGGNNGGGNNSGSDGGDGDDDPLSPGGFNPDGWDGEIIECDGSAFDFGCLFTQFTQRMRKTSVFSLPNEFFRSIPATGDSYISFDGGTFGIQEFDFTMLSPLLCGLRAVLLVVFGFYSLRVLLRFGGA